MASGSSATLSRPPAEPAGWVPVEEVAQQPAGRRRARAENPRLGGRLFLLLLCLYLLTGGGHGYSIDGSFGYEMARTVLLDPSHEYFHRFKTAFARWGVLLPVLGQPFVLAGNALAQVAPERDALAVGGHTFRVEEWPAIGPQQTAATAPLPETGGQPVVAVDLLSFLSNATDLPQGAVVGEVWLWGGGRAAVLPVRAGIETAEWAHDRPDIAPRVRHSRPPVAGHWIGQPRGNIYYARLPLPAPMPVERWELAAAGATQPSTAAGAGPAPQWQLRAAAFELQDGSVADARTGDRFWSERQTRDFFTRLIYSTLNAFTTAAAAMLVYAIVGLLGYRPTVALLVALAYGVATMAWPYAKLDFAEPASTCFELLAVWACYRWLAGAARSVALGLLASGALFLAIAGKYTAALTGAALVAQWGLSGRWWAPAQRARALAFLAALVVPAALLGLVAIALSYRLTGEGPIVLITGLGRLREDWLSLPLWTGLRGLLFSPGKSLFLYSPWLLLAVPGAVLLWRRHGRDACLFTLYPLVVVLLYSMKLVWHGGSWGPRYLLPVVPLLAVATAPAVQWALAHGRAARVALLLLALGSAGVQLLGVAKDPEQYPAIVRQHVVPFLPDDGSIYGGRDYWQARGGPGLDRALQDPDPSSGRRGLGYLWGYPDASLTLRFREPRTVLLSLYFVDWDRQGRREDVTIEDIGGVRTLRLDSDFGEGLWLRLAVAGSPDTPVRLSLHQTGPDTAVLSAVLFDAAPSVTPDLAPVADTQTRGSWRGRYGAEGYLLFAWRSFNIDVASLPAYLSGYDVQHVGDKPEARIHVEIAEQDVLDTPLLYALPFSPLLGNAWLLGADLLHLLLPGRPDLAAAVLQRPPWTWFGLHPPPVAHPEYGLGLDFWPTLLFTGYASHPGVVLSMWLVLALLESALVVLAWRLMAVLTPAGRVGALGRLLLVALVMLLLAFDWLQVQA